MKIYLSLINTMIDKKSKKSFFSYFSNTGENSIFKEKDNYFLINNKKIDFSDKNIDGDITNSFYYNQSDRKIDVVKISFLTDSKFVSISRKEGKEHYKKGKYRDIEIYLYKKNLKTLKPEYFKLELPKNNHFTWLTPKLAYYNDDNFILSYLSKSNDKRRLYIKVVYDYSGKIIKENRVKIEIENADDKFSIINYGVGSFQSYRSLNNSTSNPFDYSHIASYQFATSDSKGSASYDKFENTFYVYSGINPKKGDSSILINKFDSNGDLLWKKNILLPNTNLRYLNSFNRFLKFDISSKFLGLQIYSTKGKNYCDFYVINKETGALIASKKFRKYSFYRSNKKYNQLYSPLKLKDDDFDNLILDRNTIYSALFSSKYNKYLKQLNSGEQKLLISYFTDNGINTLSSSVKESKIIFNKFSF